MNIVLMTILVLVSMSTSSCNRQDISTNSINSKKEYISNTNEYSELPSYELYSSIIKNSVPFSDCANIRPEEECIPRILNTPFHSVNDYSRKKIKNININDLKTFLLNNDILNDANYNLLGDRYEEFVAYVFFPDKSKIAVAKSDGYKVIQTIRYDFSKTNPHSPFQKKVMLTLINYTLADNNEGEIVLRTLLNNLDDGVLNKNYKYANNIVVSEKSVNGINYELTIDVVTSNIYLAIYRVG